MVILLQKQILTCKNSIYQNDTEKTWKTKKIKKYQKWILTMQLIMQILTEKSHPNFVIKIVGLK